MSLNIENTPLIAPALYDNITVSRHCRLNIGMEEWVDYYFEQLDKKAGSESTVSVPAVEPLPSTSLTPAPPTTCSVLAPPTNQRKRFYCSTEKEINELSEGSVPKNKQSGLLQLFTTG